MDKPVNVICTCIQGMPRCSYHDPKPEAERRADAQAGIEAWWAKAGAA